MNKAYLCEQCGYAFTAHSHEQPLDITCPYCFSAVMTNVQSLIDDLKGRIKDWRLLACDAAGKVHDYFEHPHTVSEDELLDAVSAIYVKAEEEEQDENEYTD